MKNMTRKKFLADNSEGEEDDNELLKFNEFELLPLVPQMRETYGGPIQDIGRPNPYHYIEQQKMLQTLQPSAQQIHGSAGFLPSQIHESNIVRLPQKKKKFKKKKSPTLKTKDKVIKINNDTKRNGRFASVNASGANNNLHSLSNRLAQIYKQPLTSKGRNAQLQKNRFLSNNDSM